MVPRRPARPASGHPPPRGERGGGPAESDGADRCRESPSFPLPLIWPSQTTILVGSSALFLLAETAMVGKTWVLSRTDPVSRTDHQSFLGTGATSVMTESTSERKPLVASS